MSRTFNDTDSYLGIEKISINWNNRSGLLASTTKNSLYSLSRKNGCYMSWNQWSAENMYLSSGGITTRQNGCGSIVCLEFGTDIGLLDVEAPKIKTGSNSLCALA